MIHVCKKEKLRDKKRKRVAARTGKGCLSRPVWAELHAALPLLVEPRPAGTALSAMAANARLAAEVAAGTHAAVLHVGKESLWALWNARFVWRTHSHKSFANKLFLRCLNAIRRWVFCYLASNKSNIFMMTWQYSMRKILEKTKV